MTGSLNGRSGRARATALRKLPGSMLGAESCRTHLPCMLTPCPGVDRQRNPCRHCCVRGWEQQLPCLVHEIDSLCRPAHPVLGVRRVPVSAGGDHLGGALCVSDSPTVT